METKLFSEYHDLLFAYFGVNLNMESKDRIATIRRNIKLKQRMNADFATEEKYIPGTDPYSFNKHKFYNVIIRSIDDASYPEVDVLRVGISGWFKVEFRDFYHNGIEVVLGMEEGVFDNEGHWDLVEFKDKMRKDKYITKKVLIVGRIPYKNIIDYDLLGSEYDRVPHIYCDFINNGEPYEDIVYYLIKMSTIIMLFILYSIINLGRNWSKNNFT